MMVTRYLQGTSLLSQELIGKISKKGDRFDRFLKSEQLYLKLDSFYGTDGDSAAKPTFYDFTLVNPVTKRLCETRIPIEFLIRGPTKITDGVSMHNPLSDAFEDVPIRSPLDVVNQYLAGDPDVTEKLELVVVRDPRPPSYGYKQKYHFFVIRSASIDQFMVIAQGHEVFEKPEHDCASSVSVWDDMDELHEPDFADDMSDIDPMYDVSSEPLELEEEWADLDPEWG